MPAHCTPKVSAWFGSPRWRVALVGGCLATASLGCGGQAKSDAFTEDGSGANGGSGGTATGSSASGDSGGSGGTASSGGTNGTGGTSVTAGTGGTRADGVGGMSTSVTSVTTGGPSTSGTATTAGGGNGGSGGALPEACSQPIAGGNCLAYVPAFGYNTETGRCEEFVYGGCGGNDNRFENLDACLLACDPGGREACEHSTDCVIDHGCCGFCDVSDPSDLVAVNHEYASYQMSGCQLVDCENCPPPAAIAPFGARCTAGTCEVYDVRKSSLSECKSTEDCRLRAGLSCCPGCGETTQWVAVSTDYELVENELCGGSPVPCPDCVAIQPENIVAVCGEDGHCAVEMLLD